MPFLPPAPSALGLGLSASHSAAMAVNALQHSGPVRSGALVGVVLAGGERALGIWSVKLAGDLRRAILKEGMRRVEEFARRHVYAELAWPGDRGAFVNINTPEELKAAEARLARARSRSRR